MSTTGILSNDELCEKYIRICRIESYLQIIDSQIKFFEETRGAGKELVYEMIRKQSNTAVVIPMKALVMYEPVFLNSFHDLINDQELDRYFENLKLTIHTRKKSVVYPIPDKHPPLFNWQWIVESVRGMAITIPIEKRDSFEEASFTAFLHYEWKCLEEFVHANKVFLEQV